jgi:hypothetical protein
MSEKHYFVRVRGKVLGPFGVPQLRSMRDRGQFRAFHEVSEDRRTWTSASSLEGLFAAEARGGGTATRSERFPAADASPSGTSAEQWRYVGNDGQEAGPVARASLLSLRQDGTIDDSTLVWREGMTDWQPLSAVGVLPVAPRSAGRDRPLEVLDSLPLFLSDPVGNLPRLCTGLRPGAAFGLGVAFYLLAVLSGFLGVVLAAELDGVPSLREFITTRRTTVRAEVLLKLLALIATPFVALTGAVALVRLVTRSRGTFGSDTLIAGATWLPLGLAMPIVALLGRNVELVAFLGLVLSVLPILLLNSALTRAMQLSDRGAVFAIPLILVVSLYLCKVIFVALFGHAAEIPTVPVVGQF